MGDISVFYKKRLVQLQYFVQFSREQEEKRLEQNALLQEEWNDCRIQCHHGAKAGRTEDKEGRTRGRSEAVEQELIEIKGCSEAGYHPLVFFEGWRVALLNDTPRFHLDQIDEMQRHNTSDEVFLLLEGSFTLYAADGGDEGPGTVRAVELETGKMYRVPKGVWHTHATVPGTKVVIIENADVSSDNSDRVSVDLRAKLEEKGRGKNHHRNKDRKSVV